MAIPKAPTVEEIRKLRDKLVRDYSDVHAQFEEDDKFYELDFKGDLAVPDEFEDDASVLPTGRQLVDVYTDHVDLANARVTVAAKQVADNPQEREKAERDAELLAKFGKGILYRSLVEEDVSQLRIAAKHQGLYGLGCIKTVYDADRWPDRPTQKSNEDDETYKERIEEWRAQRDLNMPIVIQAVNPRNIYPDPSYGGRQFVIEERTKFAMHITAQYPEWSNPKNRKPQNPVKVTSYWDKFYRCEMADDEPLFPGTGVVPHDYGVIPYVFIESGLGNMSYDADLKKRYVGILRYLKDVLISESRNFSLYDVAMKKGSLPWYTLEGDNANQMGDFKPSYGDAIPMPKGTKLVQQFPDLAPDAVMRQVGIINSIIMDYAAPRVSQGLSEQGVRSAAQVRSMADLAGAKYQYPSESFRNKVAKILSNCATIYKNLKELDNVRVWAHTPADEFDMVIDKKRLKPPFTFHVEFAPFSDEANYLKQEAMLKLLHEGVADPEWVRKQIPNIDWRQMNYKEFKAKIEANPVVQEQLGSLVAAMVTAGVQRRMMEENINALPPATMPAGAGAPQGMMPPAEGEGTGRQLLAPSSPKPLPGSARSLDLKMEKMKGKPVTMQGQGGGGNRR